MIHHRLQRLRMLICAHTFFRSACLLLPVSAGLAWASEVHLVDASTKVPTASAPLELAAAPGLKPQVIFAIHANDDEAIAPEASDQAAQPPPAPPKPPPSPNPQNPFENIPTAPEKAPPTAPSPSGVQEAKTVAVGDNIIEAIEFRGQRKVPQDTLRALIVVKKGDVYDEESLHRDFTALWNTGRFDDLRVEREKGPAGGVVLRFVVTERRTVHTIDYAGNKSISKSEILDRFKERKVSLTPESQYDPGKVQRARNVIVEYEAERGHQYASVTPQIRQVPPGGVDIIFQVDEGPKG